jgi:hypothetical protein
MTRHFSARTIKAITIPISVIVMFSLVSTFWESLGSLKSLNYVLGWTLAIAAVAAFIVSNRIEAIEEQQDTEREQAAERLRQQSDERIALANSEAAKANESAAKANEEAAKAQQESLELARQLEAEKQKRVAHEALLRRRTFNIFDNRQFMLKPHKGTKVILENVRGEEPESVAKSIADLVTYCEWEVVSWHFTDEKIVSGIFVTANKEALSDTDKSGDAQRAMVEYIESKGFKTGAIHAWETKPLPENTVKITVGPSEIFEDRAPIRFNYPKPHPSLKVVADGPQEPPKENNNPKPR